MIYLFTISAALLGFGLGFHAGFKDGYSHARDIQRKIGKVPTKIGRVRMN